MDAHETVPPSNGSSLRSKLWAAVMQSKAIKVKELQESCAFYDCVRKDVRKLRPQLVVDVCGGHGALAMLCVAQGAAEGAVIIDQSAPPSHRHLREAWSPFLPGPITYDERPLQEALPEALKSGKRMFVLACHACQHLAWQIMEMCQSSRTPFAVCPCCPKDHGGTIKAAAKSLGVDFRAAMILAELGRLSSQDWASALRTFDEKVSPHNRVILGWPQAEIKQEGMIQKAEDKLRRAYERSHHAGSADGRAAGLWSGAAPAGDELETKQEAVRELLVPVTGEAIWEQLEIRASPRRHFRARTVIAVGAKGGPSPDDSGGLFRFVPEPAGGFQLQSTIPTETLLPQVAAALPVLAELMSHPVLSPVRCVKLHGTLGTSQLLCCLVYGPDTSELPGAEVLEQLHQGLREQLGDLLQTLVLVASVKGRQRSFPEGQDFVDEVLRISGSRELRYRQPFGQFSNPNPHIAIATAEWMASILGEIEGGSTDLLELYCGCGSHTVALAPSFRRVLAVEINRHLVEAAQHNVALNGLSNVTVLRAPSEDFCRRVLRTRSYELREANGTNKMQLNFRCTVVDPPRAGLDPVTLEAVSGYEHILYISCNPVALKSNLEVLLKTHRLCRMVLLDHFPFSAHVEMAVHLQTMAS
ncbi:unnamed protein product [Durusdinium trenchii]|uniref:Uncharacterized protein n=1 Tax=Durusdinium trenchii TaxID=1381693 RepID=A0ABP0QKE1_9DINO